MEEPLRPENALPRIQQVLQKHHHWEHPLEARFFQPMCAARGLGKYSQLGYPLEWVYYVLEALADKVLVLEFRRIASSEQIRATNFQKLIIRPDNLSLIRVLSRERHGASLKVANDPLLANQRNKTY
jgi:hypothetical protein